MIGEPHPLLDYYRAHMWPEELTGSGHAMTALRPEPTVELMEPYTSLLTHSEHALQVIVSLMDDITVSHRDRLLAAMFIMSTALNIPPPVITYTD